MANKNQEASYPAKIRSKWYFLAEKAGKTSVFIHSALSALGLA